MTPTPPPSPSPEPVENDPFPLAVVASAIPALGVLLTRVGVDLFLPSMVLGVIIALIGFRRAFRAVGDAPTVRARVALVLVSAVLTVPFIMAIVAGLFVLSLMFHWPFG